MSPSDSTDESASSRRTILKGASAAVAGFALGTGGASAAAETDAEDCGWEYRCDPWECPDGGGDTLSRRYCCNGSCSGWEVYGCC